METTLEEKVVQEFFQLDPEAQRRVRSIIVSAAVASPKKEFDMEKWLAEGDSIRAKIQAWRGNDNPVGVQELLDEIREENSRWPR